MIDAARRADLLVAAEDDQRRKAVEVRAVGVREAVLQRVLRGQERHHVIARHVLAEVEDQVTEVVLLLGPDLERCVFSFLRYVAE